ncbi:cache domain-containing protein, partial [Klebsiella pneumoniae]
LAAQPMVAATGSELNKYMSATPSNELGDQANKLLEFMTRLATTHPSYAYLSYGVNDGGYVGWPAGQKFVNYDPRTRPWYQLAMANPGKTLRT